MCVFCTALETRLGDATSLCDELEAKLAAAREETAAVRAAADAALAQERDAARDADDEVAERLLLEAGSSATRQ